MRGSRPPERGERPAPDRGGPRAAEPDPRTGGPSSDRADPPTDPHGFPPVPATGAPAAPDRGEVSALAAAFAVDYLSWDEDDPARRGRVLSDYLPAPERDPSRLGWDGRGRQRAEFALPGLVRREDDGRVLVDVRVRVTPYLEVGEHDPAPERSEGPGAPAAAPAPAARGWRSLASAWIRLSVPITHDGKSLVVDAPLAEPPAARREDEQAADEPTAAGPDGAR